MDSRPIPANKDIAVGKAIAAYEQAVSLANGEESSSDGQSGHPPAAFMPEATSAAIQQPAHIGVARVPTTDDDGSRVVPTQRTGRRPFVLAGKPIHAYADSELVALVRWIESDDLLRTEDELIDEMMHELGFRRHGKNVVAKIAAAIARSRRQPCS